MKRFCVFLAAVAVAGFGASPLWAQSATWTTNAAGNWSNSANWTSSSGTDYANGPDQTANFSILSGNANAVTDDVPSNTIGYLVFGTGAGSLASAGNTLTLQTTVPGTTPTISIAGNTTTISTALAGTQGFILTGGGALTLATNADSWTGNAVVGQGMTVNIGQSSTAGFVLNNGTTLNGNQALTNTNFVQVVSGTASASMQGASNTVSNLFSGDGTINWTETTVSNVSYANGNAATTIFGNFGGTVAWGTNGQGSRLIGNNTAYSALNPFATFDLGSAAGSLSMRNASTLVIGGLASSGGNTGLYQPGSSGANASYIIGSANSSTTFAGKFNSSGANVSSFTKVGAGTLFLTDASGTAYSSTGSVSVNGGTLEASYANSPTGVFAANSAVSFTGGTLYLLANSGAASSQSVGNVTLSAGGGALVLNGNGSSMTFNVRALPDFGSAPASSLNITALGNTTLTTTTAKLADGSYSARITYGADWATTNSGASPYTISAFSNYTPTPSSGTSDTTNDLMTDGMTLTGSYTTNQLKIATTQNGQTFDFGGNSVTLTAGGLLFAGSNDYQITDGTLQTGVSSGNDLILHQLGAGKLTIGSIITNGTTTSILTKTGPGTLVLGGSNTYTGASWIEGGVTSISSNANLGAVTTGNSIAMTGGTLQATSTFALDNAGLNMRNVVLYGGGGTFDVTAGNTLTVSGVVSNVNTSNMGPLVKTGSGTLVLSGANTYYGATWINGGVLSISSLANGNTVSNIGQSPSAAPALVLGGGVLQYTGGGASTDRSFVLTPNGGGIDSSGSGPLVFSTTSNVMLVPAPIVTTGPLAGSGARVLTLTGTNTNQNVFAGQIVDGTGGATSLVKNGGGWWTLTNNNTYSGSTTVNGGTLTLSSITSNNNIASSMLINVGPSGFLDLSGLNSSTLALAANQTLTGPGAISGSITAGALSNIQPGTVASGLAGAGASTISGNLALLNNAGLTFGLNGSNGTANTINVGSGTLALPAAGAAVNVALYTPNGAAPSRPPAATRSTISSSTAPSPARCRS